MTFERLNEVFRDQLAESMERRDMLTRSSEQIVAKTDDSQRFVLLSLERALARAQERAEEAARRKEPPEEAPTIGAAELKEALQSSDTCANVLGNGELIAVLECDGQANVFLDKVSEMDVRRFMRNYFSRFEFDKNETYILEQTLRCVKRVAPRGADREEIDVEEGALVRGIEPNPFIAGSFSFQVGVKNAKGKVEWFDADSYARPAVKL